MRHLLVLLVALSACFKMSAAANETADWQKANVFYEQKQYDSAAVYYEKIAALQPQDARVYYNLGNTYYRLNIIGKAVLNYEKALHISPSYKEATDNLSLTQSRIGNRIQPIQEIFFLKWWHQLTAGDKAGTWAYISLFIFLITIGLLLARLLRKIQHIPIQVFIGLVSLNVLTLLFSVTAAANMVDSGRGVVMQQDAPVYTSSSSQGKASALVPEGTTVEITGKKTGWVEIKLPDGRMGWMEKEMVSPI